MDLIGMIAKKLEDTMHLSPIQQAEAVMRLLDEQGLKVTKRNP